MEHHQEKKPIEIRSEEVEDILGRTPGWLTRNGMLLLLVVFLLFLAGSFIFRFPDVKKAEITVTSLQPPAHVEARADGKIEQLFVSDNEEVEAGTILAVIENAARAEDVMELKEQLVKISLPAKGMINVNLPVSGSARLGPLQTCYADFLKQFKAYNAFFELDYHNRKITLLKEELDQYKEYGANLENRASILNEEYTLADKQYRRDSLLFAGNVVSESDYENSKSLMLGKRNNWQEMVSLVEENDIAMAKTNEQILEMELKRIEQEVSLSNALEETYNILNGSIAEWEKKYLIVSPLKGSVTFNQFWSENQNVKQGDKVMSVIPDKPANLLGKIRLPLKGAGEVKEGQQVNIRFEHYPYLEYGMVKGIVKNVSKVPEDQFYTVEVDFPEGLTTYYNVEIGFHQDMKGNAEILTDRMRLIQRIFNPVRNAIARQREM